MFATNVTVTPTVLGASNVQTALTAFQTYADNMDVGTF